jgi:hypothetical protein
MDFDEIVSLIGLLIATVSLVVDLIALVIESKKGKRPGEGSQSEKF